MITKRGLNKYSLELKLFYALSSLNYVVVMVLSRNGLWVSFAMYLCIVLKQGKIFQFLMNEETNSSWRVRAY